MKAPAGIVEPAMALRAADRMAWDAFVESFREHAYAQTIELASVDPGLLARQQGYCAALLDVHSLLSKIDKHFQDLQLKSIRR